MRKPVRRVTVGGVDLWERFGLVLTDESAYSPPAPKVYQVDIPGGDGCVDVTESLAGDVAYSNRSMELCFVVAHPEDFEATKTAVCGFLHGRSFDFELSFDPGYTYHGRFSVDEYYGKMHYGHLKVTVDADPYKLREHRTVKALAAGGTTVVLECGRKRQCPTFECASEFALAWNGGSATVQPGAHRVRGLWLEQGDNELWLDSAPGQGDALLSDYAAKTVASLADERIGALFWKSKPVTGGDQAVYITYDIEEL